MESLLETIAENYGLGIAGLASAFVLAAGFFLRNPQWFQREREEPTKDDNPDLSEKVVELDQRMKNLEHELRTMPTAQDFHDLEKQVIRLDVKMGSIEATTSQTRHAVSRIEDFLLKLSQGGAV